MWMTSASALPQSSEAATVKPRLSSASKTQRVCLRLSHIRDHISSMGEGRRIGRIAWLWTFFKQLVRLCWVKYRDMGIRGKVSIEDAARMS